MNYETSLFQRWPNTNFWCWLCTLTCQLCICSGLRFLGGCPQICLSVTYVDVLSPNGFDSFLMFDFQHMKRVIWTNGALIEGWHRGVLLPLNHLVLLLPGLAYGQRVSALVIGKCLPNAYSAPPQHTLSYLLLGALGEKYANSLLLLVGNQPCIKLKTRMLSRSLSVQDTRLNTFNHSWMNHSLGRVVYVC